MGKTIKLHRTTKIAKLPNPYEHMTAREAIGVLLSKLIEDVRPLRDQVRYSYGTDEQGKKFFVVRER